MISVNRIKKQYLYSNLRDNIIKIITSISIFALTVFFTPNFKIISFPILLLSSINILILENLINTLFNANRLTFFKNIINYLFTALIIYITGYIVDGYYISIISTLIAASIYKTLITMLSYN